jgi:transcriptional regulator with XRE-family HTH domain
MKKQKTAKPTETDRHYADVLKALWNRKLAEARSQGKKWTQESAGAEMGMTQGAVSQYLNGEISLGLDATFKFANFLGVDPLEIRDDFEALSGRALDLSSAPHRPSHSAGQPPSKMDLALLVARGWIAGRLSGPVHEHGWLIEKAYLVLEEVDETDPARIVVRALELVSDALKKEQVHGDH